MVCELVPKKDIFCEKVKMRFGGWIPMGSLILLMCAHQGDATLILGSMLMAATAAMTGGLIMGPLTIGGLVMMMMMGKNMFNFQKTIHGIFML